MLGGKKSLLECVCFLEESCSRPPATLTVPVAQCLPAHSFTAAAVVVAFFYKHPKMQGSSQLVSACEWPGPRGHIQPKKICCFSQTQSH